QQAPSHDAVTWLNALGQTAAPELKGKVILIGFWGIWCGPCIAELPDVQVLYKELAGEKFLLIGLHESRGELMEVSEFARKRGITYQLAIDQPSTDGRGFGATFKA